MFLFLYCIVWRILTAPLIHPQLLMLFFVLLSYIPTGCIREKMIGTVKIFTGVVFMNGVIQILFLVLSFIVMKLIPDIETMLLSFGMWPIIIAEIVIE